MPAWLRDSTGSSCSSRTNRTSAKSSRFPWMREGILQSWTRRRKHGPSSSASSAYRSRNSVTKRYPKWVKGGLCGAIIGIAAIPLSQTFCVSPLDPLCFAISFPSMVLLPFADLLSNLPTSQLEVIMAALNAILWILLGSVIGMLLARSDKRTSS